MIVIILFVIILFWCPPRWQAPIKRQTPCQIVQGGDRFMNVTVCLSVWQSEIYFFCRKLPFVNSYPAQKSYFCPPEKEKTRNCLGHLGGRIANILSFHRGGTKSTPWWNKRFSTVERKVLHDGTNKHLPSNFLKKETGNNKTYIED